MLVQRDAERLIKNYFNINLIYIYHMPIVIRKVRNQDCWRVFNKDTGEVHAKCTTKEKAEAQKRLIDEYDEKIEDVEDNTKAIITITKKKNKKKPSK